MSDCVGTLRDASAALRASGSDSDRDRAERLGLVAMCVAGFAVSSPGDGTSAPGTAAPAWMGACDDLLSRLSSSPSPDGGGKTGSPYLAAALSFLRGVGSGAPGGGGHASVVDGAGLRLSDRVAFASRFLPRPALQSALDSMLRRCVSEGNLEGIAITGLDRRGIGLIQAHVDKTSDVQTAAFLVARAALPGDREWAAERRSAGEWTESYRQFLNGMRMWGTRAAFDVARQDGLRRIRAQQQQGGSGPGSLLGAAPQKFQGGQTRAGRQGASRYQQPSSSPSAAAATAAGQGAGVPPNLWARCNYCNASLPLSRLMRQEGIANSWLSRQKPVLSCCPQCKKPLPRCAVCLLSMGCLNPYIELQRERGAYSRAGGAGKQLQQQQQGAEDLSGLASVPFSDWWSWCLKVRGLWLWSLVCSVELSFLVGCSLTASLCSASTAAMPTISIRGSRSTRHVLCPGAIVAARPTSACACHAISSFFLRRSIDNGM